jgi:predicted Zn-ribbon and HTH transcriptional regulator
MPTPNEEKRAICWQSATGTGPKLLVQACKCLTCKGFFYVPKAVIDEDPSFCPWCGIAFVASEVNESIGEEMSQLLMHLGEQL